MGQVNSRSSTTETTSSSTPPSIADAAGTGSGPADNTETHTARPSTNRRTRRTSFRRSIRKLVPQNSQSLDSEEPTEAFGSRSFRNRWRSSRRFSKGPGELSAPNELVLETGEPAEQLDVPQSPTVEMVTVNDKGKEREIDIDDGPSSLITTELPGSRPLTPFPPSHPPSPLAELPDPTTEFMSNEDHLVSQNLGSWLSGSRGSPTPSRTPRFSRTTSAASTRRASSLPAENNTRNNDDIFPGAGSADSVAPTPHVIGANTPAGLAIPAQNARHFPPAGTLVVVQGVVHTTDSPIAQQQPQQSDTSSGSGASTATGTNANPTFFSSMQSQVSSSPTIPSASPSSGDRNRNRLSSLFPRPTTRPNRSPSATNMEASPLNITPAVEQHSSGSSGDSRDDSGSGSTRTNDTTPETPQENQQGQRGQLSQSSIDVLGTLLSVATAATAASLVSGSTDPLLSSGLTPSLPNLHPVQGAVDMGPPGTRPTSPTPTAGLGGLGAFPSLGDFDTAHGTGNDRNRVRNVWDSLRERFARIRPGNGGGSPSLRPDGSPMDAREIMLAEMARAFNVGMGMTNDGSAASTVPLAAAVSSPSDGSQSADAPLNETVHGPRGSDNDLPPEGSFERFLLNLQVDLRATLTQDYLASTRPTENRSTTESVPVASDSGLVVDTQEDAGPQFSVEAATEETQDHESVDEDTPPALESDDSSTEGSESEGDNTGEVSAAPAPDASFSATGAPETPASAATDTAPNPIQASASGMERMAGGHINWWRLYRFPPMNVPQGNAPLSTPVDASTSTVNPRPVSLTAAAATEPLTSTTQEQPPLQVPTGTGTSSTSPDGMTTVVPVIIVGLQSINADRRGPPVVSTTGGVLTGDAPSDPLDIAAELDGVQDQEVESMMNSSGGRPGTPDPARRRTWHSRAVNALRGLRAARRGGAPGDRPPEGAGSRTFMIYVIGGYYPPNHHIVTGINTLDSFEALWELADLLGHVKPPVATKEDIEKSGLQVIHKADLAKFEKEGKIASSCVERCLICLDDYEPSDNIRVMSCRHAFHKNCVDMWLETGRNNCPACRSTGVSTDTIPFSNGPSLPSII